MNGAAHPQARHPHHHQHHQHPPPPQQTASAAGAAPSSGTMIPPRMNGQHQGPMRIIPGPNAAMQPFPMGRSPPNLDTNTKHVPCKFYPLGSCNAGDACKFSHNLETAQERQPCKYFQKGNCKFGAKCALLHIIDGRLVNDPITQQLTVPPTTTGFQRQPPLPGGPQISGLSMGMRGLGPNQAPPPPTTNGYGGSGGFYGLTSPTASDGHFQLSSQAGTPPSPPKYRSALSSGLRASSHQDQEGYDHPRSQPNSFNLLGPLDAPFPSSVDLTNNQFSRHGPFAASVPAKFGIPSQSASLAASMRERPEYYPSSGGQTPQDRSEFPGGSRYGSPIDAMPWTQENFRAGNPLSGIQAARNLPTSPHHSRPQSSSSVNPFEQVKQNPVQTASRVSQLTLARARATISTSVPAAHFGERAPFSPVLVEDDALDPDALPSSLHDEVLLPQELNRRSSTNLTPGLNRRSSAYDEFARSPPSGAATPISERGAGSLSGSPGSSRMEPIWGKLTSDTTDPLSNDLAQLSLNSRQRVASPLRNPVEPSYFRPQPLKTPSGYAAQKWGGRTADKLFPQANGADESSPVNVPGIVWRRTGEVIGTGRGELTNEEVMRIKEEEEGLEFSMDS